MMTSQNIVVQVMEGIFDGWTLMDQRFLAWTCLNQHRIALFLMVLGCES
jgi:hypothetical protein